MWILSLLACGLFSKTPDTDQAQNSQPTEEAARVEVVTTDEYPSAIILDGKKVAVNWDDGDTFAVKLEGADKVSRARLNGFNTLESYGPVHKWGRWKFRTLFAVAKQAGERAASEVWTCERLEGEGGYGRLLVDCPDLRLALLQEGLAHNFSIDAALESKYVAAGKGCE